MFRSIPSATALCVFASVSLAAEIHVPDDYSTIQGAITASCDGDEIIVADGTYYESIDFKGKAITLRSMNGPGYTIIDGEGLESSVAVCTNGETWDTVLDGFTLTNGTGTPYAGYRHGGGLFIHAAYPTVRNCVFEGNIAEAGGGVSVCMGLGLIANCEFTGNEATFGGERGGGGLHSLASSPVVYNCSFVGNLASGPASGGGIALTAGYPSIANCMFFGNEGTFGGGLRNNNSEAVITNCTFAGNVSRNPDWGSGILSYNSGATVTIVNSVFWGNTDGVSGDQIVDEYGAETTVLHSIVQGGWEDGPGEGVIDEDPLFVDPDGGDLRLLPGSPCIDKGDSMAFLETGLDCDLEGNPRPVAGNQANYLGPFLRRVRANLIADVDMGAYEFQP